MTGVPSMIGGTSTGVSLQAVIDAARRLDELSTARIIGEAADAVHKAQKGGQPLGTLVPQAIVVAAGGISLAPPASTSVAYTAPEKLRGQPGDRRSDVFSLGVLLWEALAHDRLFDGATDEARTKAVLEREIQAPSNLNANVPAELDAICKKALARDPADRYQSAKVMAAEISAVLDDAGYPDGNEEIAKYLGTAFPAGGPSAASTAPGVAPAPAPGAALAAKLAATPTSAPAASKASLNMTTLGMAPIREAAPASEPVAAKPATLSGPPEMPALVAAAPVAAAPVAPVPVTAAPAPAPATPAAAKPQPVKTEKSGKKFKTKTGPSKTVQAGSNMTKPEPAKPDPAKTMTAGSSMSAADVKAEVAKQAEPARAHTPSSSGLSPMAFSKPVTAAPPDVTSTPVTPATTARMGSLTSQDEPARPVEPVIELVVKPAGNEPIEVVTTAAIAPSIPPSISQAETVATPALVASAAPNEPLHTSPSGIVGLPSMPPGSDRSFDDDFATNAGGKPFVPAAPVVAARVVAAVPAPPVLPATADGSAVDPSAAVSLPRPRSQTGGELLAGWGWSTDSHAAIDDGGGYEEEDAQKASRKRLLIAIGGALGAILLIIVIAVAASGGEDKPKEEATQAAPDTSRSAADPVAKPADPAPVEPTNAAAVVPPEPATTEPATTPTTAVAPPTEPDPAIAEAAKAEAAKAEAAQAEAAHAETARIAAAKAEAASAEATKVEAAKLAKAEALAAKEEAAKAETARVAAAKADARAAKEAKAEAARIAAAKAPAKEPTKVAVKQPTKKDPKVKTSTPKPVDPYASEKPKFDAAAAYKTGFQQYVRGDTSGALATFKSSLAASSGYPPTWRGLGLVYEKLGQKAQAKGAFRRYLQLSPNANDAEQIRTRMERL